MMLQVSANLKACIRGGALKRFRYRPLGSLASLGHHQAVAQMCGLPFAGWPAWLAWRMIYLIKLPAIGRRARVALDWIVELVLPPDIVQLSLVMELGAASASAQASPREDSRKMPVEQSNGR